MTSRGLQHINHKAAAFCGIEEGMYPVMKKHDDGTGLRWEVAQHNDMYLHLCLDEKFAIFSKTAAGPWALGYGRPPNVAPLGVFKTVKAAKKMAQDATNMLNNRAPGTEGE